MRNVRKLEPTATATVYSGRATAVRANVLGSTVVLAQAGPLPASGGADQATLIGANIPGLLTASVLTAETVGQGDSTRSTASTADLSLTVAGIPVTAGFLEATAVARCRDGANTRPVLSGSSQITDLMVAGNTITVTGEPNQVIGLPLGAGRIIINEQRRSFDGNTGSITVNALRVVVNGVTQVVISSARAGITCTNAGQPGGPGGPGGPTVGDLVGGSGKIICDGHCVNFGVSGGRKNGRLWGDLTLVDRDRGIRVQGTGVTSYTKVDANTRVIRGTATVNGRSGFTYKVTVSDNGPGTRDTFRVEIFNRDGERIFFCAGRLVCGNIRIYQPRPDPRPTQPKPPCECNT